MDICISGSIQNFSYNFNLSTGNLVWRQNNKYPGLKEDFQYDNLDRLDNVYMGGNMTLDMAYNSDKGCITHVVDATNNSVVAEYSYDSWGRMRNPATWENYTPGSEPAPVIAGRGYTGHEHLPWFNSINMNGRVYDPLIGQFLSPDNYVQSPDFTQSFNRYGYCLNNPLAYTDPSGEFVFSLFLPVIGPFLDAACWGAVIGGAGYTANVAFSDGGFNNWNWGQFGKSVGIGAISGAVTAGIGNAFGAVGSNGISGEFARACTHGFANGIISEFSGGDFMSGFVSGGLGSLGGSAFMMYGGSFASSNLGNYAFSGLAGGIGTELTGGNFWQGAATGLITAGLNHLQQGISYSIRSGDRELNPDNYVLKNNKVRSNVKQLYEGLVDVMGTEEFQFMVTGGDRYVGPDGKVYSSTDNSLIPTSGKAHILGLAVDLRIIYNNGHYIPLDFVRPIVINSTKFIFDPNAMPWHYSDWHYHLQLPRIP